MTTPATASSLREAISSETLTRARRRLLTAHPDPTSSDTPMSGSLTDEQLRLLAASDWVPPHIAALDGNTIATADPITRALLAESVRETLERRLTAERPHGTYDDTRAGHDAFSKGVVDDYDHGNYHLARATIRLADPGLVTRAGLAALGLPDTDATIIDELAQASDTNPLTRILADAALLDLDRYATGAGLRYSRVGTTLMLAAPSEQRLAEAIDAVAAAAVNAGARVTDLTTQYIDEEKALASIGIDPWATRPSDEPTGQADRILYVGRGGARVHVKAGRASSTRPAHCPRPPCRKTASRASFCLETSACPRARARGRCAAASMSCACPGEAPTKAPSSARTGERTPVGSSRKWPSPVTTSAASAWPPASSTRKSAAKSTSSRASPGATKPCTSPTRPRTCTPGGAPSRARAPSTKSWASKARVPTPTSTRLPGVCPSTSPSTGAAGATPRPAQRRPVLRVRDPPVRMRRRAPRSRARTIPRHRARAHRQAAQPGAGPHGTVPPTPGRPNRHGTPAHAQTPARTQRC